MKYVDQKLQVNGFPRKVSCYQPDGYFNPVCSHVSNLLYRNRGTPMLGGNWMDQTMTTWTEELYNEIYHGWFPSLPRVTDCTGPCSNSILPKQILNSRQWPLRWSVSGSQSVAISLFGSPHPVPTIAIIFANHSNSFVEQTNVLVLNPRRENIFSRMWVS